jgi:hypothetical protein
VPLNEVCNRIHSPLHILEFEKKKKRRKHLLLSVVRCYFSPAGLHPTKSAVRLNVPSIVSLRTAADADLCAIKLPSSVQR